MCDVEDCGRASSNSFKTDMLRETVYKEYCCGTTRTSRSSLHETWLRFFWPACQDYYVQRFPTGTITNLSLIICQQALPFFNHQLKNKKIKRSRTRQEVISNNTGPESLLSTPEQNTAHLSDSARI